MSFANGFAHMPYLILRSSSPSKDSDKDGDKNNDKDGDKDSDIHMQLLINQKREYEEKWASTTHAAYPKPEIEFATLEDAITTCQQAAFDAGFALTTAQYDNPKNADGERIIKAMSLVCECSHISKSTAVVRDVTTQATGCRHRLRVIRSGSKQRGYVWYVNICHKEHNHRGTPGQMKGSSNYRRSTITAELHRQIVSLAGDGHSTKSLWQTARLVSKINTKDIANILARDRRLQLDGKKPLHALIQRLRDSNEYLKPVMTTKPLSPDTPYEYDIHGNIIDGSGPNAASTKEHKLFNLMFIKKSALALLKRFHHIHILDATYKTNRYDMPMFHIVGTTNCHRTFSVGFIFMSKEDEANYTWCIEQFARVCRRYFQL
ncbi:MAG: transposase [Chloroflexi bacterium]|nr:MAG: transposase [Chloroflexota bacterium]